MKAVVFPNSEVVFITSSRGQYNLMICTDHSSRAFVCPETLYALQCSPVKQIPLIRAMYHCITIGDDVLKHLIDKWLPWVVTDVNGAVLIK